MKKVCIDCKLEKSSESFYPHKRSADGLASVCRSCNKVRVLKWRAENPERVKEVTSKYQKKNRIKLRLAALQKKNVDWEGYAHKRKEWAMQRKLRRYDGIVEKLRTEQKDNCALCGNPFTAVNPIDIDHDHNTGLIRGLLCRKCNSGLHYFEDSDYMRKALSYLQNPPASKFPPIKY